MTKVDQRYRIGISSVGELLRLVMPKTDRDGLIGIFEDVPVRLRVAPQ